jgi:hypothetical protein
LLRYSALESSNLKYEGEDFAASCAVLMQQFSVPADDLVERLESTMFELSNGKVGPVSAVSSRHIEAVRQQLVKKRKQEEQFHPTDLAVDEILEMQREDTQVRANIAQQELLRFQSAQRQEAQRQRELLAPHHQRGLNSRRNNRLRNEKIKFEESCLLRTYPSIKSAVWVGMPPPDSDEEFSQENVTIVVEVVSNCQTALSVHQCFSRFYASIDSFHFPHALHHVVMIMRRCAEYFPPVSRSNLTG